MIGRYKITISSTRLKYNFTISRNITVIRGDSATGKTTLVNLLKTNRGVNIKSDIPIYVPTSTNDLNLLVVELLNRKKHIIVLDETCTYLYTDEFATFVKSADNYFVIITRKDMTALAYSMYEMYEIVMNDSYHILRPIYSKSKTAARKNYDIIYTEDKQAGYKMVVDIVNCMNDITNGVDYVKYCDGKDNVVHVLLYLIENKQHFRSKSIIFIIDSAAFGSCIDDCHKLQRLLVSNNIYVDFCTEESFEYMLLQTGLNKFSSRDLSIYLEETYNFADSVSYYSWENFYFVLFQKLYHEALCVLSPKIAEEQIAKYTKSVISSKLISNSLLFEMSELYSMIDWNYSTSSKQINPLNLF